MIGSLMYLTASRPDIMFAVYIYARHQVTPKECHLHAVKRIFRYLKGQPMLGIWYPKESLFDLVAYSDSDYDGDNQDKKSTTGGYQFLGRRLILWQCKKKTIVATSTTKAKYVAAASGCGQVLWIQNQLPDYGYNFMNTKIYIDNNSAICIVKNPVYHSRTKHIDIRHHFIRDYYEKKLICVDHIHTDDNVANLLTKPFDGGSFQYLVIETADGETHISAKINGKQVTVSESSIRRKLKLQDEEGISDLSNNDLFENLSRMGYNIFPNQKFTFQKVIQSTQQVSLPQISHTPSTTPTLRRLTRGTIRIAQSKALTPGADEPVSLSRGVSHGEAFPTATNLDAGQDKENILKTSAMPHESSLKVTSPGGDEGNAQKVQEDALNRGGVMDQWEEIGLEKDINKSTEKGSESTGEMANVLSSMDAANILASGGMKEVTPTASPTPTVVTSTTSRAISPSIRRTRASKGITLDFAPTMIDELDRSNEVVNKHMEEYEQHEQELSLEEKIDLIKVLLNYQNNLAQVKKFQAQQQKLTTKTERRKFYTAVLRSHSNWKIKDFKGKTFNQIEAAFTKMWKSIEDFVPMDSQLERERVKRPGILSHLIKEAFESEEPTADKAKELWIELKRLYEPDTQDPLWEQLKFMHDPLEWRLYTCGVHHVITERCQEIFMLMKKDYPLTKGLATLMLCNKLHVEQYSEMANTLLMKIYSIANIPR
ncbi:hypothetical protein Tco_0487967 [Tanacetum coccineum]